MTASAPPPQSHSRGFPPVARRNARVLVLGSLPGVRSIEAQQYYAQPRNAFWPIMDALADAGPELSYAARLAALKRVGIALWDVAAGAVRPGSLDAAIVPASVEANDFAGFFRQHRQIRAVFFNGAKAAELYRRLVIPTLDAPFTALPTSRLPSTSPAHAAMSFAAKLDAWRVVADYLRDAD
jgi:TDG/mug DNA glycosylase family protein